MNRITPKHKITSLLLLTVIVSHFFFHFKLEEKVVCIGEGEHFHIENINDSNLEGMFNPSLKENLISFWNLINCTDFLLDNHVDEDIVKTKRIVIYKFVKTISFFDEIINRTKNFNKNNFNLFQQKFVLQQLPTILLLI